MSTEQKTLKVLSILLFLWGIACAAISGYVIYALTSSGVVSKAAIILMSVLLATVVLSFAMAVTGVRGANRPALVRPFVVLSLVAIVVQVAGLVVSTVFSARFGAQAAEAMASGVIMLVIAIFAFMIGRKVQAQTER